MNDSQRVYVGLGSNQADPKAQIRQARATLGQMHEIEEIAFSSLYQSDPMPSEIEQPSYINAVMALETSLEAAVLFSLLQSVETAQGRVRTGERWGPRTLDLDLLLCGQKVIATKDLVVPHYGMADRAFVLYPLAEISPNLFIPGQGLLANLLQLCPRGSLVRLTS